MLFEWDENKNRVNQIKHKISFETATLVFEDLNLFTRHDDRCDYGEERWQSIGLAENILLSVSYTIEDGHYECVEEIIRIISARKAGSHQARRYYFHR